MAAANGKMFQEVNPNIKIFFPINLTSILPTTRNRTQMFTLPSRIRRKSTSSPNTMPNSMTSRTNWQPRRMNWRTWKRLPMKLNCLTMRNRFHLWSEKFSLRMVFLKRKNCLQRPRRRRRQRLRESKKSVVTFKVWWVSWSWLSISDSEPTFIWKTTNSDPKIIRPQMHMEEFNVNFTSNITWCK